jgi:MFS family permease
VVINKKVGKKQFYYGWVIAVVCMILMANTYGLRFSFGVFFKSLEQDFGWTRALTSGVFSVYMLLGCLFAILGGWIADRYGAKIVFIVMAFFTFLGLSLTSQANSLWNFFLSYSLLVGIGTGPNYVVATSIVTRWFSKKRGVALAVVTSGVGLGSIVMAPLAAYLIENYGWRLSFVILGFIALIIMITCSLFFKKVPSENTALSEDNNHGVAKPSERQQKEAEAFSLFQALRTRNFWTIVAIWVFYSFCLFTVMTHLVPYATDSGITPMDAASVLGVLGLASVPSRILMGILSDRFGRKPASLIGALLMVAAMVWLIYSSNLWMLYVFAIAFGVAYGGLSPATSAVVGDIFGVRNIGVIFGLLEIGWVVGSAAGPALSGYIFDTTGRYFLAFLIGVFSALAIAGAVLLLKIPARKELDNH